MFFQAQNWKPEKLAGFPLWTGQVPVYKNIQVKIKGMKAKHNKVTGAEKGPHWTTAPNHNQLVSHME